MARSRTLTEIVDEGYRFADAVGMTDRHPRPDCVRWANKGLAELYDLLVDARGIEWFRSTTNITLVDGTTDYTLPTTFMQLLGARFVGGAALLPFPEAQSAELRDSYVQASSSPRYYQLAANNITFLPTPGTGTVTLDYVPAFVDLDDDGVATFDGVNGWETYASHFQAQLMCLKDRDGEGSAMNSQAMAGMAQRIKGLAKKRDAGAPGRIKDVLGQQAHARFRRWQ